MELSDYLRLLRAHWVAIMVLLLAGVAVAGAWSLLQPRVYTAEASGYVTAPGATDLGSSMVGDQLAQSKVRSYLDIGTWRVVAEYAIDELGLATSPEQLVDQVDVTNPTNTVILQVAASAGTPEAARDLAEAWLRGIVAQVDQIEGGEGRVAPVRVVPGDSARLPTAPSSPNLRLNLALGALIGLLVGLGLAVVRDRLDRRIRSAEGVEEAIGLSVVGALPLEAELAKQRLLLPLHAAGDRHGKWTALAEAFRGLRTNLQYMSIDDPPKAIVVTSPLPGDGKSFTAANLAIAIAAAGQRVVLVDADLRRPRVATVFGLVGDAGLSDVLAGRAEVADVLQATPRRPPGVGGGADPAQPERDPGLGADAAPDRGTQRGRPGDHRHPAAASGDGRRRAEHARRRRPRRGQHRQDHLRDPRPGARPAREGQGQAARRRAQPGARQRDGRGLLRLPVHRRLLLLAAAGGL